MTRRHEEVPRKCIPDGEAEAYRIVAAVADRRGAVPGDRLPGR